jgi:hypothetical protein
MAEWPKRRRAMLVGMLALLSFQAHASASVGDAGVQEALESFTWPPASAGGQGATAEAISLVRATPECVAARLHLRTVELDLVTLTFSFAVGPGVAEATFRDELGDWTFHQLMETSLRFADTAEALNQERFLAEVGEVINGKRVPVPKVVLSASGGARLEVTVGEAEEEVDVHVKRQIAADGFGWKLRHSASPSLPDVVRQVRSMACDAAGRGRFCSFGELLATLDYALTSASRPGVVSRAPLRDHDAILTRSSQEITFNAEELRFLSLFSSFRRNEPFRGTCASSASAGYP